MRKLSAAISVMLLLWLGIAAQKSDDSEYLSEIKKDFRRARAVAQVKIKNIELIADRGYVTYAASSEIVESFKGTFKRGQALKYYFIVEAGYDIKVYPKERIVFFEGRLPVSPANSKKGWFELENSHRSPSKENLLLMRRLKQRRNYASSKLLWNELDENKLSDGQNNKSLL